jgi:hypothetical protein
VADVEVYLEIGSKRVFACAIDWPGLCRSGRDEAAAIESIVEHAARYRTAMSSARMRPLPPAAPTFRVVEKLRGDATTDFGAPSKPARLDRRTFDGKEALRLMSILEASWAAFDLAARVVGRRRLATGPRGGGRQVDAMREHVLSAERAYLSRIGGSFKPAKGSLMTGKLYGVRGAVISTLNARASGEPAPHSRGKTWPLRYHVRRSAWHVLDHAWEIEDRLG